MFQSFKSKCSHHLYTTTPVPNRWSQLILRPEIPLGNKSPQWLLVVGCWALFITFSQMMTVNKGAFQLSSSSCPLLPDPYGSHHSLTTCHSAADRRDQWSPCGRAKQTLYGIKNMYVIISQNQFPDKPSRSSRLTWPVVSLWESRADSVWYEKHVYVITSQNQFLKASTSSP